MVNEHEFHESSEFMKTILVTGSAGFIGSNLVLRLLSEARACSHSEESKQASLSSRSNAAFKEMSVGTMLDLIT